MSASGRIARGRPLVPAQRRQLIADRIRETGSVSVSALEAEFGVSPMTARRDLQILEREGRALRTHGGAVSAGLARDPRPWCRCSATWRPGAAPITRSSTCRDGGTAPSGCSAQPWRSGC